MSVPPRRLYRIVTANPPSRRDFMSHYELGRRPLRPLSRRDYDRWRGVSHFDSLEQAEDKLHESPWLGNFIAEIEIPPKAAVRIQQTGAKRSHYTVWADAGDLLRWIVSVRPISEVQ